MPSERRYIEISESPIAKCHQWAIIRRKEFHKIQNKLISKLRKTLLVHDVADMSWCIQRQAAPRNRQYCTYTISVICLCLQGKKSILTSNNGLPIAQHQGDKLHIRSTLDFYIRFKSYKVLVLFGKKYFFICLY